MGMLVKRVHLDDMEYIQKQIDFHEREMHLWLIEKAKAEDKALAKAFEKSKEYTEALESYKEAKRNETS